MPLIISSTSLETFVKYLPAVFISWNCITLWYDAIRAFVYNSLKLDSTNPWHVFGVALFFTLVLVLLMAISPTEEAEVEGDLGGGDNAEA